MNLDAGILDLLDEPGCRLEYGVVDTTSPLKVFVAGSTTSTTCKALTGVIAGDFVAVLVKEGDRLVLGRVGSTGWTAVTFQNSWANYGAGYQGVEYRKVGDMVQLRGVLNTAGTSATAAFTLPVGFRPLASLSISAANSVGAQIAMLDINASTGVVLIYYVGTDSVGISTQFSISP